MIQVSQVKVSQDGNLQIHLLLQDHNGKMKEQLQSMQIMVANLPELNIEFFKNTSGEFTSNYEVKIPEGGTFDVQYTMKGGIISSM